MFGDPFALALDVIPGQLAQPELQVPFEPGITWSFTGGPHPGYRHLLPFGALDFAPPVKQSSRVTSTEWVTAVHGGAVAYSGEGRVELDLGNGWTVVYLHVAALDRIPEEVRVNAGDQLGHPSCEGGTATGTRVHLSRRYNGEWIPADGFAPFEMSGWVIHAGPRAYEGFLTVAARQFRRAPASMAQR